MAYSICVCVLISVCSICATPCPHSDDHPNKSEVLWEDVTMVFGGTESCPRLLLQ